MNELSDFEPSPGVCLQDEAGGADKTWEDQPIECSELTVNVFEGDCSCVSQIQQRVSIFQDLATGQKKNRNHVLC